MLTSVTFSFLQTFLSRLSTGIGSLHSRLESVLVGTLNLTFISVGHYVAKLVSGQEGTI